MVRENDKESQQKKCAIILEEEILFYWIEMKEKLNFRDDKSFILFLLHLAKNEFNSFRRKLHQSTPGVSVDNRRSELEGMGGEESVSFSSKEKRLPNESKYKEDLQVQQCGHNSSIAQVYLNNLEEDDVDFAEPFADVFLGKSRKETSSDNDMNMSPLNEFASLEFSDKLNHDGDENRQGNDKRNETEIWQAELPSDFIVQDCANGAPKIVAKVVIEVGRTYGPIMGGYIREADIPYDSDMVGIWQVGTEDKPKYLSSKDAMSTDWLNHIPPAPTESEANMITTPKNEKIFFCVTKRIEPGRQLFFWTQFNDSKWMHKFKEKVMCGGCNLQLNHVLYFKAHCILFHHPGIHQNIRKYYCKICGKGVLGRNHLSAHTNEEHKGFGAYQCNFCLRFFKHRRHLRVHKNFSCDKNPKKKKVKCEECHREFSQPQKLKTHMKVMHGTEESLKDFKCSTCDKVLSTADGLMRHKREVHRENKTEICDRCGKHFTNRSNLKIHMLTHSKIRPFLCEEEGCNSGYTTKQRLAGHYRAAHGKTDETMPEIKRSVEYTFDAYGRHEAPEKPRTPPQNDEGEESDDSMSPLSVGNVDLPLQEYHTNDSREMEVPPPLPAITEPEVAPPFPTKGSRKWLGSPMYNYSDSFLVDEAISAVEKDGIDLPYDSLQPLISSPPMDDDKPSISIIEDSRSPLYSTDSPPIDEQPPIMYKSQGGDVKTEESTTLLEEPLKLRDYNISSIIPEDLQNGKDTAESVGYKIFYREDALGDYRRSDPYRRDGMDGLYAGDGEVQNLCLKEKPLHLDLPYKPYDSLDDLERLGRDPTVLETLLVGDQNRALHLSPRYHPTYETESMDLSLPRMPYPTSPIYSLDLPTRFDLPSGRLMDLRSHLGLSPHRFGSARLGGSPPQPGGYLYQPAFGNPSRLSPTPTYHPYPTYY